MVCNEREWVNGGLWQSEITIKQTKEIVDGKMKCYKNAWRTVANTMKKKAESENENEMLEKKCLKKKIRFALMIRDWFLVYV